MTPAIYEYISSSDFKRIFNRLYQQIQDQKLRNIVIMSPLAGEGRTFMTLTLGYALKEFADSRVLYVNTSSNHQKKSLHPPLLFQKPEKKEEGENSKGVNKSLIPFLNIFSPKLKLTTDSEMHLIKQITPHTEKFEVILYDTEAINRPHSPDIDPLVLASQLQDCGCLLVLSRKSNRKDIVDDTTNQLEQMNLTFLGVIYNEN